MHLLSRHSEMKKKLASFFLDQNILLQDNSHSLNIYTAKSLKSTSFARQTSLKQQFPNIFVWNPFTLLKIEYSQKVLLMWVLSTYIYHTRNSNRENFKTKQYWSTHSIRPLVDFTAHLQDNFSEKCILCFNVITKIVLTSQTPLQQTRGLPGSQDYTSRSVDSGLQRWE